MNKLITPEMFTSEAIAAMQRAEDAHGLPRGALLRAWVEEFNKRFPLPTNTGRAAE